MLLILAIVAIVLVEVWLFAVDRYVWSFLLLVASAIAAFFLVPPFTEFIISYGWQNLLMYALPGYVVLGALTASLKWIMFARGVGERLADFRATFESKYVVPKNEPLNDESVDVRLLPNAKPKLQEFTGDQLKKHKRAEFISEINRSSLYTIFQRRTSIEYRNHDLLDDSVMLDLLTPRTRNYIERVSFWVLQWPIVLINFVLEDLIIKLANHIARLIDTVFNRLARMFVGNAIKGL